MSETELKTYNVNTTDVSFAGNTIRGPWAEDDGINIVPNGELWNEVMGMKGGYTRGQEQGGRHFKVTLQLQATSPSNKTLTALAELDTDREGPGAPAVLNIRDSSLEETFSSAQAFIFAVPERGKSKAVGIYEWVIAAPFGTFTYG